MSVATPAPSPTATPIVMYVVVTATPLPSSTPPATATASGGVIATTGTGVHSVGTPGATFQLCTGAAGSTERAIAQFIGGRPFRASLTSQSSGCAQLDIHLQPAAGSITGRQSTSLSTNGVTVQIVSEQGTTTVKISGS